MFTKELFPENERTEDYSSCTSNNYTQFSPETLTVNGLMTLGFTGAHQQVIVCNESLMLEKLPRCGKSFEEMMKKVDSKKWCNLTEFIPITLTSGPQKTSHVRQIWIEKGLTKQRYNTGR
ncbi:receptor activity-modifying protein 3 isoform X3 [Trachemys scripta elegans]|uniref:receptor activity-modifying protein 3 isoform X3 n=1 Tax=Trachemys scripta elegans TaxID=31138 RepID=UPI001554310A|nr:receptor activity-modifying protein 3 isoform X3 [Trachemys scripta elegans]